MGGAAQGWQVSQAGASYRRVAGSRIHWDGGVRLGLLFFMQYNYVVYVLCFSDLKCAPWNGCAALGCAGAACILRARAYPLTTSTHVCRASKYSTAYVYSLQSPTASAAKPQRSIAPTTSSKYVLAVADR